MTTLAAGIVRDVAEDFLLLARSIADAEAVEWVAAPVLRPRRDQVTRALSEHADPTGMTATDERRLALRARADEARAVLSATRARLRQIRHELDRELAHYEGEEPPTAPGTTAMQLSPTGIGHPHAHPCQH
ncbi:hypothetical protein C4K88_01070 [Arthrobacter pityocampae]|uniref:Uncharacterized protein n=1 Tax=Arthrobacter pityocampae TaxID=547334 RepID=A0A2S5J119_9MICC|nr:hypothetical protein [Arthrobacter pityocampae]PPB50518.1 hypothetical protein C4K88_01070 [Arthrobacter pityocampae]